MKRIILFILLAAMLSACARIAPQEAPAPTAEAAQTAPAQTAPTVEAPAPIPAADSKARLAFRDILEHIHDTMTYPTDEGYQQIGLFDENTIEDEQFAILDIDGDGDEELAVRITNTYMAGMILLIYNRDEADGTVHNTLAVFPGAVFFANGTVQAMWSHNHGHAGEALWPYTLIEYDKAGDRYIYAADVDAWDKSIAAEDWDGTPFPEDMDPEGTGVVYIVTEGQERRYMSRSDFLAWETPLLTAAPQLELPWQYMTAENIHSVAPDAQ